MKRFIFSIITATVLASFAGNVATAHADPYSSLSGIYTKVELHSDEYESPGPDLMLRWGEYQNQNGSFQAARTYDVIYPTFSTHAIYDSETDITIFYNKDGEPSKPYLGNSLALVNLIKPYHGTVFGSVKDEESGIKVSRESAAEYRHYHSSDFRWHRVAIRCRTYRYEPHYDASKGELRLSKSKDPVDDYIYSFSIRPDRTEGELRVGVKPLPLRPYNGRRLPKGLYATDFDFVSSTPARGDRGDLRFPEVITSYASSSSSSSSSGG